jgi:serine/threonine protein kinase
MPMLASANPLGECPGQELLLQFDLGMLPDGELARIEFHVSSCDQCVETLHKLQVTSSDDPVVACLKHYLQGPSPPVSPEYAEMEARARMLGGDDVVREVETWGRDLEDDIRRMVGRRIGPYEVLGKVGRGGMGIVYKAWQRPLDRPVAIKMILAGHHASAPTVARFLREGRAVARLAHPNVVRVHDLGDHEGLPYLSMEFIDGESLEANLGDGPMELRAAAALVATLAKAVAYAHNQGVVHRDLKPANILLTREGVPKITDFGLAKFLDPDAAGDSPVVLTETDTILGTPSYMAPEQADGRSADISTATDVYALGAILYALLTGRPPFVGEAKIKVLERVRSAEPIPPSRLRPEVPSWLEAICLTCLEKSPSRRFSSAQALADDLERWLRNERPRGTPSGLTRLGRTVRKRRHHFASAGAILSIIAGVALHDPDRAAERIQSELAHGRAGVALHDPDRAAERIQSELAHGRAVSLVGKSGEPDWFRWRSGKFGTQTELGDDRAWTISSWNQAILELVPDPQVESYRLIAQVRHDKSDRQGDVGLYFGYTQYRFNSLDLHYLTYLSFNSIISRADHLAFLPAHVNRPAVAPDNVVSLRSYLVFEPSNGISFSRCLGLASGPAFKPGGPNLTRWHDLEIVVTPSSVTCSWDDGQPFTVPTTRIQAASDGHLKTSTLPPRAPLPRGFLPKYDVRGGIGLYVFKGSAAFRSVKLTPLKSSRLGPPTPATGDHRREVVHHRASRED